MTEGVNSGIDLESFCRSPKTNKCYWFSGRRDLWKKKNIQWEDVTGIDG